MSKRRLIRWSIILAILAAFVVWLEPTRVVWGWLRGEAFYQGRPTNWWAAQVRPWAPGSVPINDVVIGTGALKPPGHQAVGIWLHHQDSPVRAFFKRWIQLPDAAWPEVLDGDPQADRVLRELQNHADGHVRAMARLGWLRLNSEERGPVITLWIKPSDLVDSELRHVPMRAD